MLTKISRTTRLKEYLDNQELSPHNVKTILRTVRTLIDKYNITVPTDDAAIHLKSVLKDQGKKSNTIRLYIWALRYWAQSQGSDISFEKCPLPREDVKEPMVIDNDLCRRLLNDPLLGMRDKAVIATLLFTGCRVGELSNLKYDDVDLKNRSIKLTKTKTKKDRVVPIPDRLYDILSEWRETRQHELSTRSISSEWFFVSQYSGRLGPDAVRAITNRIKRRYQIKKLHPHLFRHTALTRMANTPGISLRDVQVIAGHSSLTTTERYCHTNLDALKQKMSKLTF
jgi:integrase